MSTLPPDHPDRQALAAEVHARPPEALDTPARVSYVAVLIGREQRELELAHLARLCTAYGVAPPPPESSHFTADLGPVQLKWERHSEFSGYAFTSHGTGPHPFGEPPVAALPTGWLSELPGLTIFAAHATVLAAGAGEPDTTFVARQFDGHVIVGAEIAGGAGYAFTDFLVREDGFGRFLLLDRSFTPRQAGRMVQRLLEIETYRMMALLAFPLIRPLTAQSAAAEQALTELTTALASPGGDDDALLQRLTRLAAEVQGSVTRTQFRFSACRAYAELVRTRISELRERRLPGIQPIEEFMSRRFSPAVARCASTAQRLLELSDRIGQASALLSTRVDIAREQQNQRLLESMNLRAERQFRMQQAVESLSVAAIVYYGTGLVGYLARALRSAGLPIDPEIADGIAIPVIAVLCLGALRRAHRRLERLGTPSASI
jgi:uncharacterized membrane-anchored protein